MTAPVDPILLLGLGALLFAVASLYSSVGHGGASGYLALLSFFAFAPAEMATTALTLNVLVAGTAFLSFRAAGHFRLRLLLPFVLASIPAAFVGGLLSISARSYAWLLGTVLIVAAVRLAWGGTIEERGRITRAPETGVAVGTGAGIGLLSGIVGVGGGIFLSPIMILKGWATARETAAVSAAFIFLNSLSGLGGRVVGGTLVYGPLLWLIPVVIMGGIFGSGLGAQRARSVHLRRLLSAVLILAAFKLAVMGL